MLKSMPRHNRVNHTAGFQLLASTCISYKARYPVVRTLLGYCKGAHDSFGSQPLKKYQALDCCMCVCVCVCFVSSILICSGRRSTYFGVKGKARVTQKEGRTGDSLFYYYSTLCALLPLIILARRVDSFNRPLPSSTCESNCFFLLL